jgi:anti-sigma B factor antagonist
MSDGLTDAEAQELLRGQCVWGGKVHAIVESMGGEAKGMNARIESVAWDGGVSLRLIGELDLATHPEIETLILQRLETEPSIVIDLSGLTFMDSSGLRTLIQVKKAADALRRPFALVRGPSPVHKVFEITGLLDYFTFVDAALPHHDPSPA